MDTPPHKRLDQAMDARRIDLDLSWKDVAAAARISEATLRAYRTGGRKPTARAARRLEEALKWFPGSIDRIYGGGEPVPTPAMAAPEPATGRDSPVHRRLLDLLDEAEAIVDRIETGLDERDRVQAELGIKIVRTAIEKPTIKTNDQ